MLLVVAPGARAQVNIEKLRSFDVDGIAGSVTGDISLLSGNSEAVNVGVSARFDYRRGKRYIFLIGNVRYGESRKRKYRERAFSHLRYNYDFTKRLVGEVFGQIERNALTLLRIRLLGGGGLRYRFFLQEHIDLFLGSSLLLSLNVVPLIKGVSIPGVAGITVSLLLVVRLLRAINKSGKLDRRGGKR